MDQSEVDRFERFVRDSSGPLLRTAHLLTGDPGHAEDLLQIAYERLAHNWSRLEGDPEGYIRRILVNLARDRWRRHRRRVQECPAEDLAAHPTVSDATANVDLRGDLLGELATLGSRQRAVLVLRFFADLPEAEVASILGCSVGTVKSTTHKALVRLRAQQSPVPTREGAGHARR